MSPCRSPLRTLAAAAAGICLLLGGCHRAGAPGEALPAAHREPRPEESLLTVDGLTITFGELAPHVAWLHGMSPDASLRARMRKVLDGLVLPLRCAQREFAAERAEALAHARALCAVAGNVVELEANSRNLLRERKEVLPANVEMPIAQFLFDPARTGAASQPIELPQGYAVVGAFDLERGGTPLLDHCDALQVAFYTHRPKAFLEWRDGLRQRLAGKVTYVHPDFRDAIPEWLPLP